MDSNVYREQSLAAQPSGGPVDADLVGNRPTPASGGLTPGRSDGAGGVGLMPDALAAARVALLAVRSLLSSRKVRTRIVGRVGLRLGVDRPYPLCEGCWYAPELLVFASGGWRVATVTVGARAGRYLVALPQRGRTLAALYDRSAWRLDARARAP